MTDIYDFLLFFGIICAGWAIFILVSFFLFTFGLRELGLGIAFVGAIIAIALMARVAGFETKL